MSTTEQAVALISAIRTFTVDVAGGRRANGPVEAALTELGNALEDRSIDKAKRAHKRLCKALAADTQDLREAAEGYFGGDFRKEGDRP